MHQMQKTEYNSTEMLEVSHLFHAHYKVFSSSFIFGTNLWHEPFDYEKFCGSFQSFLLKIRTVFLGINFEMSRFWSVVPRMKNSKIRSRIFSPEGKAGG